MLPILKPYKLVSRELSPDPTLIEARGRRIGDGYFGFIAGPCTVETREQTLETARAVAAEGVTMLRGGAFKPRTSPYAFQGLGDEALEILKEARAETGLPLVTELMDPRHVEAVVDAADVIQIGARNMSNFSLLSEVGRAPKPVLLKRGLSSTVEDLLMAAEYIVKEGNSEVILCERGIKTFETATRFTLDIGAIPVLKQETHLPVIVDPCCRSRALPSPREPTGSSSRCTRGRRRRCATRRSRSRPRSSATSPTRSARSRPSWAARSVEAPHVPGAALASEPSARREGQYVRYDRAPSARDRAASVVSLRRSPALPGRSRRRPGT